MGALDTPRTQEQWTILSSLGQEAPRVSSQWILYAGGRAADYVNATEQWVAEVVTGLESAVPAVHEQWVLTVIDEQVPTVPVGSWIYTLDGHLFYGLNLGKQGTLVYDATTQTWSQWRSGSLPWFNMNLTLVWQGQTYGASLLDQTLVRLNPDLVVDDGFRENTFVVSGRLESTDRRYRMLPEIQIFGSIGLRGGDVSLRYSDNDGATWSQSVTYTVPPNARGDNVVFYNLGSVRAPGRLFEIEDAGTLRRVSNLVAFVDGPNADG